MNSFKLWLEEEEECNEGIMRYLAPFIAGFGLMSGGEARGDDFRFSGNNLVDLGISQKKLSDDEFFIKSVMQSQETRKYIREMERKIEDQSSYIKDLFIEIIEEDKDGMKVGVLVINATIHAPDASTAKAILINAVMKFAQKNRMGLTAVRGMKQMVMPEGIDGSYRLKMKLYPDFTYKFI